MKSQYPQYAQGQGEWERNRNEGEHGNPGQDFGRQSPRGFEGQPGQHQQSQREHGGLEYYGSAGGYGGGRGDYAHQGSGQGSYGGRPGEESQYRGGAGRQQEAFHSGGRQQGFGEGGGYGGYGREGEQHFGRQGGMEGYGRGAEERYAESARQQGQTWGEQGRYQGYGQSPGYYGHQQPGQPQPGQQGFGQWGSGYGSQRGMGRSSGRKGPKDYVRSDERIREAVCERLMEEQAVDVSDVSVQVKEGRVTLEGTVPDRHMRHIIEDVADDCWGVKDVENHIRVQMPQYGMTTSGQEATGASGISSTGLAAGSATSQGTPDATTRQPNAAKSSA